MSIHHRSVLGLALFAALVSHPVFALEQSNPFSHLAGFSSGSAADPIEHLRRSYEAVIQNLSIRSVTRDHGDHALVAVQNVSNNGLETTKFQHYFKGLEVVGSMAFHHAGAQGEFVRNGLNRFDLNLEPTLSAQEAVAIAQSVQKVSKLALAGKPELKILPDEASDSASLVYFVQLGGGEGLAAHEVIINAHSGQVIADMSSHEELAQISVSSGKSKGLKLVPHLSGDPSSPTTHLMGCTMTDLATNQVTQLSTQDCQLVANGRPLALGAKPLTKNICQLLLDNPPTPHFPKEEADPDAISLAACTPMITNGVATAAVDASGKRAASNTLAVLTYYMSHHNRNSYDGLGSPIKSVVHMGINFGNAFWDTKSNFMAYGDGDGIEMGDMTQGLDVVGHEITHGVTAATAHLMGKGESGSLNEGNSDIFGKMVEGKGDWRIGRVLFIKQGPDGAIRDMANPASLTTMLPRPNGTAVKTAYPVTLSQEIKTGPGVACDGSNDNCWSHINSTIWSHGYYLVFQAIGQAKAEKLYYATLTHFLKPTSTFRSAAADTLTCCASVLDAPSCIKVKASLSQVGLL